MYDEILKRNSNGVLVVTKKNLRRGRNPTPLTMDLSDIDKPEFIIEKASTVVFQINDDDSFLLKHKTIPTRRNLLWAYVYEKKLDKLDFIDSTRDALNNLNYEKAVSILQENRNAVFKVHKKLHVLLLMEQRVGE